MAEFDVIILGGGGAGYTAAFELSKANMKVLLLEPKGVLGGNCLYEGCIPSKTLWYASHFIDVKKRLPFLKVEVDFEKVMEWKDTVQELRFGQHDDELKEHENVTFMKAEGRLIDTNKVKVGDKVYTSKYIVVATGAKPNVPPGFEDGITTHELLMPGTKFRKLPETLAIIGGGYIGVEMAGILAKFGVKVTLYAQRILKVVSQEVQQVLENRLRELGVEIVKERCKGVKADSGKKKVLSEKGEKYFDEVLVATGRVPETSPVEGIVPLGKKGEIDVDYSMASKIDNIYAPGDVNGRHMLFHVAVLEGWIAAQNIIEGGRPVVKIDYNAVPYAVYSDPQVAWAGMWKEDAIRAGFQVEVRRFDLSKDSRAQIDGFAEGWMDIVVEQGSQRILGAQIVGEDADLLIGELALVTGERLTTYDLARLSQPHPTQLESILTLARKITKRK
ncbi:MULTISPECIES: dihydrolipoyl dehydrogenase [Sulfolobaceae]|uniref:dihydrolipoyl dehydrogenase n=1 Tax=Sulfolobaceae TaxID=118883 RepID=UPI00163DABCC|nr:MULTISPECIES: dihydrolipoyl dehydrogenase [unclassified Sulfolobus]